MKITLEGENAAQILAMLEAILNKGYDIVQIKDSAKMYANQAAASASRADTAARNAEMAAENIKKGE